jgi:Xaa-Pro aminopeptidase
MDHVGRRDRLVALLAAGGVDALLVTVPVNVTYLTGVVSSNAALLVGADGEAVLATDDRYAEAAAATCPDVEVVTTRAVASTLAARAARRGDRLAIERHHVTLSVGDAIASAIDDVGGAAVQLVDLDQAVEGLRAVKQPEEVDLVAAACSISVHALADVLQGGLAGRSEREIARDVESRMLRAGADALAFETIVASGPNGSVPHHSPSDRVVQRGDLVTIDFGAMVGGYHADCTRTVLVAGPSADWQQQVYELVADAQRAGVAALAPGRSTAEIDAASREVIVGGGYGEFFSHGLGHGVGLQIHEPPWLSSSAGPAARLPTRTTVTVEPGIYLPGKGGVRIEDTTDVGPDGVRVLTDMTTDLITVDD